MAEVIGFKKGITYLSAGLALIASGLLAGSWHRQTENLNALKAPNEPDVESRINLVAEVERIGRRFAAIEEIKSMDEANGVPPQVTESRLGAEVKQLNLRLETIDQFTTIEDRDTSELGIVAKHTSELAKARSKGTNVFVQLQHEIKTYVYLTEHYDNAENATTNTKSLRLTICKQAIGNLLNHQDTANTYLDKQIAAMVGKAYDDYNVEILGLVLSGEKPNKEKVDKVTKDLVDLGYTAKHNRAAQAVR